MKRTGALWVLAIVGVLVTAGIVVRSRRAAVPGVAHERPYEWDRFVLPKQQFTQEPLSNVVSAVNNSVRAASKGAVVHAIDLDAAPAPIKKVAPSLEVDQRMDEMISNFRLHEQEMMQKGASGYEGVRYSGQMWSGHSLGCAFRELAEELGLDYEENQDGIHLRRAPRQWELRAYKITDALVASMEKARRANSLHVHAEPIVSAFAQATSIHSWSIMLPDGPNSWHGEVRFDKVFRHLPDQSLILALAPPEQHREAESRLKAAGLWAEVAVSGTTQ